MRGSTAGRRSAKVRAPVAGHPAPAQDTANLQDHSTAAGGKAAIFLRLVLSYWRSPSRLLGWLLLALLLTAVLAGVWLQARINVWNGAFFDALEKRNQAAIGPLLWQFAFYVLTAGFLMVATVYVRMFLQVQVRKWVTSVLYSKWLASRSYLRLDRSTKGAETPEFRMADDVRLALDQLVDLSVGFFSSVLLAITFFEVLARVGGAIRVDAMGATVPAYFLFAAVLYALMMSGTTSLLGWPLVGRIQRKNHAEGEFRYHLMRVRENAGAISGQSREHAEGRVLAGALDELVAQWRRVFTGQAQVSGVASANAVLVGIFPVILALPKYMTGELTLGAVMQLATAFVQVQMALNWIVDNFIRFAEFRASANRVGELVAAMDGIDGPAGSAVPVQPVGEGVTGPAANAERA